MRELTVRIRFLSPSLGNQKLGDGSGRFIFQRNPHGDVIFLPSWHQANMRMAAQLLNRHQKEVQDIHWDINVDGTLRADPWYKNYYRSPKSNKMRYSLHEAFIEGQIIGLNCIVPSAVKEEDFWRLMGKAGQYKGLSPWKPGEFGFYEVVSIRPRRSNRSSDEDAVLPTDVGTGLSPEIHRAD
jgi:hypothetical protein